MIRLSLFTALLFAPTLRASINEDVMLDAIAMVETGNRADVVGKAHERGAFQMTPAVRDYVGGYDRAAAHRWLKIVLQDMRRAGVYVCPVNTALAWNASVSAIRRGRIPMASYSYSQRVSNTYDSLLTERVKLR